MCVGRPQVLRQMMPFNPFRRIVTSNSRNYIKPSGGHYYITILTYNISLVIEYQLSNRVITACL